MLKYSLALLCVASLGACNSNTTGSEPEADPASETTISVEPDNGIGDGAESLSRDRDAENAVPEAAATIPNTLIGVWDYENGTCDPASDMRLEIGSDEFRFYESVGSVKDVRSEGDATIVDLAMEGEGETWEQSLRLVLKAEGTRLHVTEPQKDSDVDEYPRRRCPA